jgi:ATP-dependent RNA helicase DDX1
VPTLLGGGDVLAAAETGSGKTGAFGMPILQIVHEAMRDAAATTAAAGGSGGGGGAGAGVGSSAAGVVMSLEDRNAMFAVSADGTLTQARNEKQWAGGRASVGLTAGKHYYEASVRDDGLGGAVHVECSWHVAFVKAPGFNP